MFNLYDWGGYLLWRLAPRRVFIDGRVPDQEQIDAYVRILTGRGSGAHGQPFWKAAFAARGVRWTVTPFFDPLTGEMYELVDALAADPAWVPVFASPQALVFVEDTPENRGAIARNALPKGEMYRALAAYCEHLVLLDPSRPQYRVGQGDVLLRLGDRAAALAFEEALRIAPRHAHALERVARLRAGGPRSEAAAPAATAPYGTT